MANLIDRSILRCIDSACGLWNLLKSLKIPSFKSTRLSSHKYKYRKPEIVFNHTLSDVLSQVDNDALPKEGSGFGHRRIVYRGPDSVNDTNSHLLVSTDLPLEFFVVPFSYSSSTCFYGHYLGYLCKYEVRNFGEFITHVRLYGLHLYVDLSGNLITHRDSKMLKFKGSQISEPEDIQDYTKDTIVIAYQKGQGGLFAERIKTCDAYRPEVDTDNLAIIMDRYLGNGQSRYLVQSNDICVTLV